MAQLYLYVDQATQVVHRELKTQAHLTFNERDQELDEENKDAPSFEHGKGPRRNLYIQYKAFPHLESIRTSTIWQENEPAFSHRT